jgi:hypothetical protein
MFRESSSKLTMGLGSILLIMVVALSSTTAACAEPKLTRARAAKVIADSEAFKEKPAMMLCIGEPCVGITGPEKQDLAMQKLGYILIHDRRIQLSEKGRQASKAWRRIPKDIDPSRSVIFRWQSTCNYLYKCEIWTVPIMRGRSLNITGIYTEGAQATAEFTWEASSLTSIGTELMKEGVFTQIPSGKGTALFQLYDDGWRLQYVHILLKVGAAAFFPERDAVFP